MGPLTIGQPKVSSCLWRRQHLNKGILSPLWRSLCEPLSAFDLMLMTLNWAWGQLRLMKLLRTLVVWGSSCVAVVQISGLPGVGSENQKSSFLVFLSRSFMQSSMESQISTRSPTSHASPLFNLQLAAYDSVSGSVQAFETPRLHSFSISFSCSPK